MANLGDLVISVGAKIDGFKQAMSDVSSSLGQVVTGASQAASRISGSLNEITAAASKMTSVGTTLTAALTLPLVGIGVAALKTAGELEQNSIAFKTLLGSADAAKAHLDALRKFAAETPFEFPDLVTASKRMQALGFQAKDVIPMLRTVGDAAAALGMGAEGIQRITTALGQMSAKGKVQAEEMRQLAEAGIPAWQILAKTLNTDVAGAMKLVEKRAVDASVAIPAILNGMNEKFGGLMAEQSKTLLGQWSNLKDQITFTLTDLGTVLMPIAKRLMENIVMPMLTVVKDLAAAFQKLPGPAQTATLGMLGFLAVVGPLAAVVGKLVTTVTSTVSIATTLASVVTSVLLPSLVATQAATVTTATSTAAMGTAFFATGTTATTAMNAATVAVQGTTTAVGTLSLALGGIAVVLATVTAGWIAYNRERERIKEDRAINGPRADSLNIGKNDTFTGFGYVPSSIPPPKKPASDYIVSKKPINQADYIFQAPFEVKPGTGKSAEEVAKEIKAAFGDLGIKDLQGQLEEALKAFHTLKAAGKLSESWQIEQATEHINDLRGQIAELAAGWKQLPKPTNDLLDTLGVKHDSASRVQEMGAALAELSSRIQAFVGPQQAGGIGNKLTEAWQNYAHAVATADDEFKKHIDDVPWLKYASAIDTVDTSFTNAFSSTSLYVKTVADLNQELKAHNDVLRELPEQERALTQSILDPWAAIKGVTDAFHYFNIKTPQELADHAKESKRQYEIIKNAAGDAAVSTQIAWHKAMLDQIEMDHELGITDQELYEQRKRMAEDALKHLEGQYKGNSTAIKKDRYDLGKELESMSHRTFDSLERDLAKDIVQWKGWKDTIKDIGQTLATDFVQIMLKGVFKPLEDAFAGLAKKAGDALSGIFGGTSQAVQQGTQTATTAASGAASGAGSAASGASSGIGGIVNMVTGAVSAVSAVIGNFQMMGMNKSLDVLVNHTLRIFNVVAQMLQEMYDGKNQLFAKLDDIWNEVRNVVTAIRGGVAGQGGAALDQLRDYAALQVRKVDEFIVPRMDTMIGLMKGGQMAAATPGNITIYVQGGDPAETARQVVSHLKRNGVYL